MEFSTIGAEDSLDEAKLRLDSVEALIVWGDENILGVLTKDHLGRDGNCGSAKVFSVTPNFGKETDI